MTTELAVAITEVRQIQTAELLEWMIGRHPDPEPLCHALESVNAALGIVKTLPAAELAT